MPRPRAPAASPATPHSDAQTMHRSPGGRARLHRLPWRRCRASRGPAGAEQDGSAYVAARDQAHVLPRYPEAWHFPSLGQSEAQLHPAQPRGARSSSASSTRPTIASRARPAAPATSRSIEAAERSLMATGAMLLGGAAYNNGIVPYQELHLRRGLYPRRRAGADRLAGSAPAALTDASSARAACSPSSIRCRPGRSSRPATSSACSSAAAATSAPSSPRSACPIPTGSIQRLEEPGRPDLRQSNRGPGTGLRVAIPVLNIHKTRLNDPFMWFMGTNDQPGDYRHSGCAGCHVVYANDREPRHSLTYAQLRPRRPDARPSIRPSPAARRPERTRRRPMANHAAVGESGHPLRHVFTRAIPTAQCMNCHMHQPNIFLNSYLGYTMWDYESDAAADVAGPENRSRTPAEEADTAPALSDRARSTRCSTAIPKAPRRAACGPTSISCATSTTTSTRTPSDTQFADYHGHGWNFRAVFKRDREGNLLDAEGKIVAPDDPEKFRRDGRGPVRRPPASIPARRST